MQNLNEILTLSVEKATDKLLNHFQSQYGSLIFLPLGVNNSTPKKIAPGVAQSIATLMIQEKDDGIILLINDEKVGQVFDSFINNFFSSLNFIAKGVMKALGMKLIWNDFSHELTKNKTTNPATHEKWKKNLTMVLEGIFTEIVNNIQSTQTNIQLTNGVSSLSSVQEAIEKLTIFQ